MPARALDPADADLLDLGLPEPLLQAALDLGFVRPTPIQAEAIPALLAGRDITGVAQTGTGKTAAFGLPLLAAVDADVRGVQALVLTPTRELAMQVAEALESFAVHMRGLEVIAVYGGAPFLPQQRALARGAQVVVGTPGRVIDHLNRHTLRLDDVRFLVLDEADEMLRMGFAEDVDTIFGAAPAKRQVALFSATMPPPIVRVAAQHLNDPVRVAVSTAGSTVAATHQSYVVVPHRFKVEALTRVLATTDADATIVFTRTRGAADEVGAELVARGLSAATISGDVAQKDREKIVERLRAGALDVLVATDVAARGLDVERIGLVVNYDVPTEPEAYIHRIGRTGRAGRTGEAITFVTPSERSRLRAIERTTRQRLEEVPVPTAADVAAFRVRTLLTKVEPRREAGRLEAYRAAVVALITETGIDPIELATALAALAVGDDGTPAEEIAATPLQAARGAESEGGRVGFTEHGRERPTRRVTGTKYRLAVGHTHGARPEHIVGAITKEGGLRGSDLGKIDIFASFSLVEIAGELSQDVFRRIAGARVAGRPLAIALDKGPRGRGDSRTETRPETRPETRGAHGPRR